MKRFVNFITRASSAVFERSYLRLAFYVLVLLAVLLVWLVSPGTEVSFIYNEF